MTDVKYTTLNEDNFQSDVLDRAEPILVDFWAPWCGPCRIVDPIVRALAVEFEGRVTIGKVNIDEHPRLASRYGIHAIPTLLIFQNGQLVDQVVGVATHDQIAAKLNALVSTAGVA